jgi:hypothetical protein
MGCHMITINRVSDLAFVACNNRRPLVGGDDIGRGVYLTT